MLDLPIEYWGSNLNPDRLRPEKRFSLLSMLNQALSGLSTLHYSTLHYTTLHYTTLHYTTPHHTTLHYTTPHHTTPHYTTLHYTTLHYTTLHYTTPHHTTPYHTTGTTLHYTTLHYTTLCTSHACLKGQPDAQCVACFLRGMTTGRNPRLPKYSLPRTRTVTALALALAGWAFCRTFFSRSPSFPVFFWTWKTHVQNQVPSPGNKNDTKMNMPYSLIVIPT